MFYRYISGLPQGLKQKSINIASNGSERGGFTPNKLSLPELARQLIEISQ